MALIAHRTAVIEMARASGLSLVGGAARQRPARRFDPPAPDSSSTGRSPRGRGAVIVGLGGSADDRDGGLGAVDALRGSPARFRSVELEVVCDVRTRFVDAAAVFAPQKGASPAQVGLLTARLVRARPALPRRARRRRHRARRRRRGGLAGGLAALGGRIVPGFELVAEHVDLPERIAAADAVVTGEGYLDAQSLDGKVVGGVCQSRHRGGDRSS